MLRHFASMLILFAVLPSIILVIFSIFRCSLYSSSTILNTNDWTVSQAKTANLRRKYLEQEHTRQ